MLLQVPIVILSADMLANENMLMKKNMVRIEVLSGSSM